MKGSDRRCRRGADSRGVSLSGLRSRHTDRLELLSSWPLSPISPHEGLAEHSKIG
jgi:hypothetical protein